MRVAANLRLVLRPLYKRAVIATAAVAGFFLLLPLPFP
eukprot:COSAG05_NODE_1512_length_4670_cov_13.100416_2_plen_37_part_01